MKTFLPLFYLFTMSFCILEAQQDPHISFYRYHMNTFNPAVAGSNEVPIMGMSFRSQWQGFENAPEIQLVSIATPTRDEKIGLGIHLINDKTFVERQTQTFGSFSYRLILDKQWDLFLGLQAGFNSISINAFNLNIYSPTLLNKDPKLIDYSHINPNLGVGAYLKNERFYLSLSTPKIFQSTRFKNGEGLVTTATDRVHYYASGGALFELNKQWDFIPSFLIRYVNHAPLLSTLNASLSYNKTLDFGIEYNLNSGMGAMLMVDTQKTFSLGYAYVTSLQSSLNQFSKGSHEVILRIKLGKENQMPLEKKEDTIEEDEIGTKNLERKKSSNY